MQIDKKLLRRLFLLAAVIKRTINRRFVFYGASIAFVLPQRQLVRGNP